MQLITFIIIMAVFVLMGVSIVWDMVSSHRYRQRLERSSAAFQKFMTEQLRLITPDEQAELDKLKEDLGA